MLHQLLLLLGLKSVRNTVRNSVRVVIQSGARAGSLTHRPTLASRKVNPDMELGEDARWRVARDWELDPGEELGQGGGPVGGKGGSPRYVLAL